MPTPHQRITGSKAFEAQTHKLIDLLYDTLSLALLLQQSRHDENGVLTSHLRAAAANIKNAARATDKDQRAGIQKTAHESMARVLRLCGLDEGPYLADIRRITAALALA